MSLQQKESLADEIFAHQPNLLASVIAQQRLGVSYEKMDFLLEILLICYQAMKETGMRWALICEDNQEYQMTREAQSRGAARGRAAQAIDLIGKGGTPKDRDVSHGVT
jgi:hypothetical protein